MILYCKFYLNTDLPIEIIENSLGKSSFDYLDMRISCFKNTVRNGNDFTYWPYYLDFEPIDDDNYNDEAIASQEHLEKILRRIATFRAKLISNLKKTSGY